MPCYDLVPVTEFTLGPPYRDTSGTPGSLDLTGGEYKTWERIHRSLADLRLLAIPASWSRVSDFNPNWGYFWRLAQSHLVAARCNSHCIMCVAQAIKGHADLASSSPSSPAGKNNLQLKITNYEFKCISEFLFVIDNS